jgi:CheY-like chemotaxis protein
VLVVDDEPDLVPIFSQLFAPARVHCVQSVAEAQQAWSDDLTWVLSDIVMPVQTGLDLRRWVEAQHPSMLGRFLLMTGSAVDLRDEVDLLPPSQVVLKKPLSREALLKQLALCQYAESD